MTLHARNQHRNIVKDRFYKIRNQIIDTFEELEKDYCIAQSKKNTPAKFVHTNWKRPTSKDQDQGGGQMGLMKGQLFEKVGVNFSCVFGDAPPQLANELQGPKEENAFWASGISLVAHMRSPHVPNIHMNTRFISTTTASWFGGCCDLNPVIEYEEDTKAFHQNFQDTCNQYNDNYYCLFKKQCDKYFYIKHRGCARGAGGIFFDRLNSTDWEKDFAFAQDIANCLIKTFPDLVKKRATIKWNEDDRQKQLEWRGRYVEFNLLYDRGTKFGLMSDANPDAVLMSLPPLASWGNTTSQI